MSADLTNRRCKAKFRAITEKASEENESKIQLYVV